MISQNILSQLPRSTGVYVCKKGNKVVYIGKSVDIRSRILSHIDQSAYNEKEKKIVEETTQIETIICNSDFQAVVLESQLIQQHRPKYNVIWKDDKSYLYIKIPIKDQFPRISLVRKEDDGSSLYFGPFNSSKEARYILRSIRSIIPFCTQKESVRKECFYSKINLCSPCPATFRRSPDKTTTGPIQKRYKKQIKAICSVLRGKTEDILKTMKKEMKKNASKENYEKAKIIRDKILLLEDLISTRSFERLELSNYNDTKLYIVSLQHILQLLFNRSVPLHRIECYDVSNLTLQQATASLVVATEGALDKSQYRRFKLSEQHRSDFDLLSEAISRRLDNKQWPDPDLIVVDGGAPQVRTVQKILSEKKLDILCIGLAKHPDRVVFIQNNATKTARFSYKEKGFNLLRLLRDEAHRFAKKYHLLIRKKQIHL